MHGMKADATTQTPPPFLGGSGGGNGVGLEGLTLVVLCTDAMETPRSPLAFL